MRILTPFTLAGTKLRFCLYFCGISFHCLLCNRLIFKIKTIQIVFINRCEENYEKRNLMGL